MVDKTVDGYIDGLEDWQKEIVSRVRKIILENAPNSEEAVKWAQPVYSSNGPFAFVKAFKKHVNFGFWRGTQLDDPEGLLQGEGVKMRHVKLTSLEDVKENPFGAFIRQAVDLNQQHGDPSR
jgi:hypothetical protein